MEEHSENWHQKQLIQWVKQFPWGQFLFHIPNETTGGTGWIARNSQMGCRSGVPDLMLPIPMHGYNGLFIAMKRPGGRLDGIQRKWLAALNEFGYLAVCCKGWEEARGVLQRYMEKTHSAGEAGGVQAADRRGPDPEASCDLQQERRQHNGRVLRSGIAQHDLGRTEKESKQ